MNTILPKLFDSSQKRILPKTEEKEEESKKKYVISYKDILHISRNKGHGFRLHNSEWNSVGCNRSKYYNDYNEDEKYSSFEEEEDEKEKQKWTTTDYSSLDEEEQKNKQTINSPKFSRKPHILKPLQPTQKVSKHVKWNDTENIF